LRPCSQLDPQLDDMKTNTGGCCHPWSKKKICCVSCSVFSLVVSIVIVGLVLSVYLKPSLTHQDSAAWDEKLSENSQNNFTIDGVYKLVSFSDSYSDYLSAMGVPWYVLPLVLSSSETLDIEVTEDGAKMATSTDFTSKEVEFEWKSWWNTSYGRNSGIMWTNCRREAQSVVMCQMEEREKGWDLTSKLIFSESGLVNEREFLTQNITTKKYFEKAVTDSEADDDSKVDSSE